MLSFPFRPQSAQCLQDPDEPRFVLLWYQGIPTNISKIWGVSIFTEPFVQVDRSRYYNNSCE